MITILIKLIAAHLSGDFILQTRRLCAMKFGPSHIKRIEALSVHSFIVAALSYLFVGIWECWQIPLIVLISHFVIDYIKTIYGKNDLAAYISDQIAHYIVIGCIWWIFFFKGNYPVDAADNLISSSIWVMLTAFIVIFSPASILIKTFIEHEGWLPLGIQGMPNAGKWIGYIERALILIFIFSGHFDGIGFLLAAKSIFRFGELSRMKDIQVTEYVLIGTFTSFAIAIIIGLAAQWLISFNYEFQVM